MTISKKRCKFDRGLLNILVSFAFVLREHFKDRKFEKEYSKKQHSLGQM